MEVDFDSGMIYNRTKGTQFKGQAFPEFMQKIIKAEGLCKLCLMHSTDIFVSRQRQNILLGQIHSLILTLYSVLLGARSFSIRRKKWRKMKKQIIANIEEILQICG